MIVGVPNETNMNETRAAIIPPVAEELVDLRRNIRSFRSYSSVLTKSVGPIGLLVPRMRSGIPYECTGVWERT
jgi:hypothetical protein